MKVIEFQTHETLSYQVVIIKDQNSDLKFLIEDYVNHMKHHLEQIKGGVGNEKRVNIHPKD